MANQLAIRSQTEPGDEILCHEDSHIIHYETGGPAAISGCMIRPLTGARGIFTPADVLANIRPGNAHFAPAKLLVVENTQNRGGGSIWPLAQLRAVTDAARSSGLRCHLDGARLWNAHIASGVPMRDLAAPFDTVSCCFSKGLGAPVGSIIAGDAKTMHRAHRFRKMLGGGMRQSGILAAAAIYAMDHHVQRLATDHANAKALAAALAKVPGLSLHPDQRETGPETNIVYVDLAESLPFDAAALCTKVATKGVLMLATGPRRFRVVTHLDVSGEQVAEAARAIAEGCKH
jgi:threonine aldolase